MISDYASLQAAVASWLNKSGDSGLTAQIPTFIQLAEARFRRKLDDTDQDIKATLTFTDGAASLPSDFGSLRDIDGSFCTQPITFEIVASQILTCPAITGDAEIIYKQSLPALSDTVTTNWLLARAPDAYLFGSLIQAEFYGWNDERLPLIKAALDEMIDELVVDSEARRWNRDSLSPMPGRT